MTQAKHLEAAERAAQQASSWLSDAIIDYHASRPGMVTSRTEMARAWAALGVLHVALAQVPDDEGEGTGTTTGNEGEPG